MKIEVSEGEFRRNFLHVSDAEIAIDFFEIQTHYAFGQIFNFGTINEKLSKIKVFSLIKAFLPKS